MYFTPIKSNVTQVDFHDGTQILFSYRTPVAGRKDGHYIRTSRYYSPTTTKHINQWLEFSIGSKWETQHEIVDQSVFDDIVVNVVIHKPTFREITESLHRVSTLKGEQA